MVQPNSEANKNLSKGQELLQEMFSGNGTFGKGQNLPVINRSITSGGGLIKNGDQGETMKMFGGNK